LWLLDKNVNTVSSTGINASGDERLQFLTEQCSSMKLEFKSKNYLYVISHIFYKKEANDKKYI
jgi:hypothetical protein